MLAPSYSCCEHDMKTCRRQAAWDTGCTVNTPPIRADFPSAFTGARAKRLCSGLSRVSSVPCSL